MKVRDNLNFFSLPDAPEAMENAFETALGETSPHTKATDADGLVFSPEKLDALAASDRRCYLLNPLHNDSAFTNYLQIGERAGIWRLPDSAQSQFGSR
jgi:hypothetical protein